MTLSVTDLMTPATVPQWTSQLLQIASITGLSATSWQSAGIARTIMAVCANAFSAGDQVVSTMNQGGFGSTAAAITIDPSVNPGAGPGYLDFWAAGRGVTRLPPVAASGVLTFTSTSSAAQGPFQPGQFHVADPVTGATYSNVAAFTIAANATTTAAFVADAVGPASTAAPGGISTLVTPISGVSVTNATAFVGANAESNAAFLNRCLLKLGSLSPNGPRYAYEYAVLSATQAPFSVSLQGGPITRVAISLNTSTGIATIAIANAGGQPVAADLAAIQAMVAALVVPGADSVQVVAASTLPLGLTLHAYCPPQYAAAVAATLQVAAANYIATLPVGGVLVPGIVVNGVSGTRNVMPLNGIIGACFRAAPYLTDLTVTETGGPLDDALAGGQYVPNSGSNVILPTAQTVATLASFPTPAVN